MPPPAPAPAAIRLGTPHPYLKTHGTKVARLHLLDWIVLALLVAIDAGLNLIEPFHRFVGEDMMTSLRYPLKRNTVPIWAVPIYAVIGPMIIIVVIYMKRRNVYDLHHAILGLLFSVLITAVLTDAIKDGVGRPRPNFFWRCFPDGIPGLSPDWASYHGTSPARSRRSTEEAMWPSSASSSCLCFLQRWLGSRGWMTTGTIGRMCLPVEFLDMWLLPSATFSSSHHLLVNKDFGLMHTLSTFFTLKLRTRCS